MHNAALRILVGIAGASVVGTATYANIQHSGGIQSTDAPLAIALAALLTIGMAYAVVSWMEGRRVQAFILGACLLCGEGYWALANAEREVAGRDARVYPIEEARKARAEALAAVDTAKKALADTPDSSPRLKEAIDAKHSIDAAVLLKSAEDGCRAHCKELLQSQVKAAQAEVDAARNQVESAKAAAKATLSVADAALAKLPDPPSATPLPDRVGMPAWLWDLILAGLRTMGIVGGSLAIGFAIHSAQPRNPTADATDTDASPSPQVLKEALPPPLVDLTPAARRDHVARFLKATVRPDPEGAVSLKALADRYPQWRSDDRIPAAELGQELRAIFRALGLRTEMTHNDMVIYGASFSAVGHHTPQQRLAQNISS